MLFAQTTPLSYKKVFIRQVHEEHVHLIQHISIRGCIYRQNHH